MGALHSAGACACVPDVFSLRRLDLESGSVDVLESWARSPLVDRTISTYRGRIFTVPQARIRVVADTVEYRVRLSVPRQPSSELYGLAGIWRPSRAEGGDWEGGRVELSGHDPDAPEWSLGGDHRSRPGELPVGDRHVRRIDTRREGPGRDAGVRGDAPAWSLHGVAARASPPCRHRAARASSYDSGRAPGTLPKRGAVGDGGRPHGQQGDAAAGSLSEAAHPRGVARPAQPPTIRSVPKLRTTHPRASACFLASRSSNGRGASATKTSPWLSDRTGESPARPASPRARA